MNKKNLLVALSLLTLLFSNSLLAADYKEGVHYQKIALKSSRYVEGKIEVTFFYDYSNPASLELNSHLNSWLQTLPENVYFIRRPSTLGQKNWALALSYTRAEMLGKGDDVNAALFKALNQTPPGLNSMQELVAFNGEQEINGNLPTHILQANFKRLSSEWADNPKITTPSIVVAQKYLITKKMAGSDKAVINLINELIKQESAAK
ncbi:MAG: hypothetical protein DRQ61_05840 [Gammaproteobacteria bacterium]|nr:MAG: hypothetical protein DRQ56_09830 [Gammaproteobacteria bacterium]RLA22616.1 MAG: hypothetical protein DRQ61_05840 [Gammaproteobacteria bacterium]